jgi:hypothetical protein
VAYILIVTQKEIRQTASTLLKVASRQSKLTCAQAVEPICQSSTFEVPSKALGVALEYLDAWKDVLECELEIRRPKASKQWPLAEGKVERFISEESEEEDYDCVDDWGDGDSSMEEVEGISCPLKHIIDSSPEVSSKDSVPPTVLLGPSTLSMFESWNPSINLGNMSTSRSFEGGGDATELSSSGTESRKALQSDYLKCIRTIHSIAEGQIGKFILACSCLQIVNPNC